MDLFMKVNGVKIKPMAKDEWFTVMVGCIIIYWLYEVMKVSGNKIKHMVMEYIKLKISLMMVIGSMINSME